MNLAESVAIATAERVERTAGATAGLYTWRKLAEGQSGEARGKALLGALRCALALRDLGAIYDLTNRWETVDAGFWDDAIATLCKAMARGGLLVPAAALAYAEARRGKSARALYAYARCLDVAGDPRAAAAFADAAERADVEGAKDLARTSRIRRASWLARSSETVHEAVEEAKGITARDARPDERLVLARVLLRAPSRFVRAGAIGLLDDLAAASSPLATKETRELAARAVALAARHADDAGDALTPLESDRIAAVFARESFAKETTAAKSALAIVTRLAAARDDRAFAAALDEASRAFRELAPLHARAREILGGRVEVHRDDASKTTWGALLDAVVALRDGGFPRAAHALRGVAEAAERGERLPAQAWTVALAALGAEDAEVRGVAGRLVVAMFHDSRVSPPRGWLAIADGLAAAGMDDLATTARRHATLAKEPGAAESLCTSLTRAGWQLARSGDRSRAIARLREAKALSEASNPST